MNSLSGLRYSTRYDNRYKVDLELDGKELYQFEKMRYQELLKAKQKFDNVPARWYVKTNDAFYVYDNASMEDYTLRYKIHLKYNEDIVDSLKEAIRNEAANPGTNTFDSWSANYGLQRGNNSWDYDSSGNAEDEGRNDDVDGRKSERNRTGAVQQSGGHSGRKFLGYDRLLHS